MLKSYVMCLWQGHMASGKEMRSTLIGQGIVNGIVSGLKAKLAAVPVYTEAVGQDTDKPYLLVKLKSVSHDQRMNGRFARSYAFDIEVHSDTNANAYDWLEQMLEVLVEIDADDGPLRGTDVKAEMKDGVLHVEVSYIVQLMKQTARPPLMNKLEQYGHVARGG